MTKAKKCLYPPCQRTAVARGLCQGDYATARELVRAGKTTWEQLEREGKSLPVNGSNLRRTGATDWFLKRKGDPK